MSLKTSKKISCEERDNHEDRRTGSVNNLSKYLEGKPAYKIYREYKEIISEGNKGIQFAEKIALYSGAKNDDEIMAAIACFTLLQIEEILKSLHKDICNNPIIVDAMKQMYQGEKMNTFKKKVIQYWRAAAGKEVDEAIEKFTDLEKIILLRVLHKWYAPEGLVHIIN